MWLITKDLMKQVGVLIAIGVSVPLGLAVGTTANAWVSYFAAAVIAFLIVLIMDNAESDLAEKYIAILRLLPRSRARKGLGVWAFGVLLLPTVAAVAALLSYGSSLLLRPPDYAVFFLISRFWLLSILLCGTVVFFAGVAPRTSGKALWAVGLGFLYFGQLPRSLSHDAVEWISRGWIALLLLATAASLPVFIRFRMGRDTGRQRGRYVRGRSFAKKNGRILGLFRSPRYPFFWAWLRVSLYHTWTILLFMFLSLVGYSLPWYLWPSSFSESPPRLGYALWMCGCFALPSTPVQISHRAGSPGS